MDLSEMIAHAMGTGYAVYIFLLGACKPMRVAINELLCEVFDASLTDDEKSMVGPPVVVPPLIMLTLLGVVFMLLSIAVLGVPLLLSAGAAFSTACIRRQELLRKELEDLGRTDLE